MKMTPDHVELLREQVSPLDTPQRRARYLAGDFPRAELVQDLDKRYRWDLFWETPRRFELGAYSDAHIDTALRHVVAPLGEVPVAPKDDRFWILDGIEHGEPNRIAEVADVAQLPIVGLVDEEAGGVVAYVTSQNGYDERLVAMLNRAERDWEVWEGGDGDVTTVTYRWSTEHGYCYECGLPAAFAVPDAYGPGKELTDSHKRCAVCAANAAAVDGERVVRLDGGDD